MLGRKHSGDTLRKMSKSARGREIPEQQRQKISETLKHHFADTENRKRCATRTGILHREDTKAKMSQAQLGEKNHNWRGGANKKYPTQFDESLKEKIRLRDEHTCQMPGCAELPKGGLCIHHINYDHADNGFANLITLCRKCHNKTTFGDRISWQLFFTGLQELRGIYRIGVR